MTPTNRRGFLVGVGALMIATPAIVKYESIMRVKRMLQPERWVNLPKAVAGEVYTILNANEDEALNVLAPHHIIDEVTGLPTVTQIVETLHVPPSSCGQFMNFGHRWFLTDVHRVAMEKTDKIEHMIMHGTEISVKCK